MALTANEETTVNQLIARIVDTQLAVDNKKSELRKLYPEYDKEMAWIAQTEAQISDAKDQLKEFLAEHKDYDIHKAAGYVVFVSRVVKLEVENLDLVPDDLKEEKTEWVVDVKEAQERTKVLGEAIPGFKDKSSYRLNFKPER